MALDAATLALLAAELKERMLSARIDKIFQPTRDEVLIAMRSRTESFKLFVSARSGSARIGITEEKFENPQTPPSFCMLLRKYLTGGRLDNVRTVEGERIVFLDFTCTSEMGDTVTVTLAAELMGRYSNLVVINGKGKIIDALKRVDFEASELRQLLPGLPYTLPPQQDKPGFMQVPATELVAAVRRQQTDAASALMRCAGGIGPVVCREITFRALGEGKLAADELTDAEAQKLTEGIDTLRALYAAGGTPTTVCTADGKPIEFSFVPLTQYLPACCLVECESYSALLDDYYSVKDAAERMRQKSRDLTKSVQNLLERARRKQNARIEEQKESNDADHLRICGELLQANLYAIEKGARSVTVTNYYDGQPIAIKLDARLSPSANAQKYFKEYKKKLTAAKMLVKLLEEGQREIEYLTTVLYEVEVAAGEPALEEIRAELKAQGYLRSYKLKNKKQKPADFIRYTSSDGFSILVGRNNLQNDKLTLHTARGKDLWFHTKNAPGSHTVVMSEGREIPDTTKNEAAMLAVAHSSQAASAKVAVDYTEVKNIRKTSDLAPGMVLYEHYETAYITPEQSVLEELAKTCRK